MRVNIFIKEKDNDIILFFVHICEYNFLFLFYLCIYTKVINLTYLFKLYIYSYKSTVTLDKTLNLISK